MKGGDAGGAGCSGKLLLGAVLVRAFTLPSF